jgi:hypothetical protein
MNELSLHILDIASNSTAAGASVVEITVDEDIALNRLTITIKDDGKGMDSQLLSRVRDPFTTSRTTRGVGMGIPLFENAAVSCGGGFDIKSEPNKGTVVTAWFEHNHIDRQPLGDIVSTLVTLITGNPDVDFVYCQKTCRDTFRFDTKEIKTILKDTPINTPEVVLWLQKYLREGLNTLRR